MTFPPLHLVTDDGVLGAADFAARAADLLHACGPRVALHLRGPGSSARRLFELAGELIPAAADTGAWLLVNDRIDVARAAGATGVQLGTRSLSVADARRAWPAARVGASVHAAEEAEQAERDGTDWVVLGTIYASASHPGRVPAGPACVRAAADRLRVPLVAIGGMTPERVPEMWASGARGVAVLGAVWHASDAVRVCRTFLDTME